MEHENTDSGVIAERSIDLEGGVNFRDLGGYPTVDGRRVKWNRLFRSGALNRLTDRDIEYLSQLNIQYCCDFRADEERQREPSRLPALTQLVPLTIDAAKMNSYLKSGVAGDFTEERMMETMRHFNVAFASTYAHQFRGVLHQLLEMDGGAMLINCSAGKDRTGFGSALILSALGVPKQHVIEDYLLSARYFVPEEQVARILEKYADHWQVADIDRTVLLTGLGVKTDYILAALDHIENNHGTIERYLEEVMSVPASRLEVLRNEFTE